VATQGQVTYTVTVTNTGPDDAVGVSLQSSLSGGTLVSATPSQPGATCAVRHKIATCTLGPISTAGSQTVTIVGAAPKKVGTMSLKSTVSSPTTDATRSNNTAVETTRVVKA
jgi:uncharacterized repeat protein (TIGR01451 family)